ncbi:UDP glycosyltransferase 9 [Sesamum alatum]|uniref:UDP glycosyltransferase 9 n=1 Tax=Sesamum alatum TaxID=300844 RepID=A0AAE1Y217_9LAMI|nr:UDP glycosyltransferase 9 [Sesamum alatum]
MTKSEKSSLCGLLTIDNVSDGSEDVKDIPESIEGYLKQFKAVFSKNLARFIDEQRDAAAQVIVQVTLPSLPALGMKDLPSFLEFKDSTHDIPTLMADQFSNLEKVDWIFLSTFDKLENEVVDWMASQYPIKTIGTTCSLLQRDKKLSNSKNHTITLLEPACAEWLESRETGSVVYVSFGSIAYPCKKQMEEVAWGLTTSNCYFLWVVRP